MKLTSFQHMNCSLAQTLSVIGERWSLLIIRDASFGVSRFDDFQRSLGVARNMLSLRLKQLTEAGILAKQEDERGRSEYRLTDKGWDLMPVLLAAAGVVAAEPAAAAFSSRSMLAMVASSLRCRLSDALMTAVGRLTTIKYVTSYVGWVFRMTPRRCL